MKETLLDKVNQFKELAAKSSKTIAQTSSIDLNNETALSKVIKTKEDGELYMKRLRALE
ncbi:MAG: hypothetical protein JWO09_2603 [Bacteroidetes bacterium]|nr:hypothetical protein [Bacteroidota bacterium]